MFVHIIIINSTTTCSNTLNQIAKQVKNTQQYYLYVKMLTQHNRSMFGFIYSIYSANNLIC